MLNFALDVAWILWITTIPLALMWFFLVRGLGQKKWDSVFWTFVVFLAVTVFLAGGDRSVFGILLEKILAVYDENKNTAALLQIIESKSQNVIHTILLTIYTVVKYLIKTILYSCIISLFGKNPNFWGAFWGMLFRWYVLVIMICIFGLAGLNINFFIQYEGFISITIFTALFILKAIFGERKKWSPPAVVAFGAGWVVAFSYALAFEARVWRNLDAKVFGFILGA